MKQPLNVVVKFFITAFLFIPSVSHADYFRCLFTEPFFEIFGSTDVKAFNIHEVLGPVRPLKVRGISDRNGTVEVKFADGQKLIINRFEIGSDGMSDFKFPHSAKFNNYYGGCTSESRWELGTLEMWRSLRVPYGLAFVDFWPGEYGNVTGYKVKRDTTFLPEQTWENLEYSVPGTQSCTLKKGKMLVKATKEKNEIFGSLQPIIQYVANEDNSDLEVQPGEKLSLLSHFAEGFCLVGYKNQTLELPCPVENIDEDELDYMDQNLAPFGRYAFVRCEEGYYTWIGDKAFDANPDLEPVSLLHLVY